MSDNLSLLKGPTTPDKYPFKEGIQESYNAIWPPGYPLLMAFLKIVLGVNSLLASKIVNLVSLGFIFRLLYLWMGAKSRWIACFFCTYSMLDIFSHTWSEGVFIASLLWLFYLLSLEIQSKRTQKLQILIFTSLMFLVLFRYAGLSFISFLLLYFLYLLYTGEKERAGYLFFPFLSACIFCSALLGYNLTKTGELFGNVTRIKLGVVSWISFGINSLKGIVNEFFLIRNFYSFQDPLFYFTFLAQVLFVFFFQKYTTFKKSSEHLLLLTSSLFYLLFMLALSRASPVYTLYYRLLAPFSILFFCWIVFLLEPISREHESKVTKMIYVFSALSLVMNLPKNYLWNLIF